MRPLPLFDVRRQVWVAAAVGIVACAIGGFRNPEQFFHSYLFAFAVASSVTLGCLGLLLLYLLVGGKWGKAVEPLLVQGAALVPFLPLFFIPLVFGLSHLYPWTHGILSEGPSEGHQHTWFALPFYYGRAVVYFAIWWFLSIKARANVHLAQEREAPRAMRVGSLGLVVFFMTVTFAAIDWVMSLQPRWSSSMYPGILLVGDGLTALAFMVFVLNWLKHLYPNRFVISPEASHDLGNLILAFTLLWTYTNLSQFLIIWSGNLPEEVTWYLARRGNGWYILSSILFVGQFGVTFAMLLSRARKRTTESLATVAAWVLVMRLIDNYWLIAPDLNSRLVIHLLDVTTLLAVGGTWFALYCQGLEKEIEA